MGKTWSTISLDLCYMNSYMASGHTCGLLSHVPHWRLYISYLCFPRLKKVWAKSKQKVYPSVRKYWVHEYPVLLLSTHNYWASLLLSLRSPFHNPGLLVLLFKNSVPRLLCRNCNSMHLVNLLGVTKKINRKSPEISIRLIEKLPPSQCLWAVFCGYKKNGRWSSHKSEDIRAFWERRLTG